MELVIVSGEQDIILTVEIEADCRIGLSKVVSSSDLVFSSILNGDIFQQQSAIDGVLIELFCDHLKTNKEEEEKKIEIKKRKNEDDRRKTQDRRNWGARGPRFWQEYIKAFDY